jgi:hypothetical protein
MAFVLDAALDSILSQAASLPSCMDDAIACAHAVLAMRPPAPSSLALCGRALETLAPILSACPALATPANDTFFALAGAMHAARGGVPIGNSDTAPFVREQRQLTKCYCALASRAAGALAPLLDVSAERTQQLTAAGVLGDADRNTIYEGLTAIAARCGMELFGRVFSVLLEPMRSFWQEEVGAIANVRDLVARALTPVTQRGDGLMCVGQADMRVKIFYTLQLLTFCSREAKNVADGGGSAVRDQQHHLRLRVCTC